MSIDIARISLLATITVTAQIWSCCWVLLLQYGLTVRSRWSRVGPRCTAGLPAYTWTAAPCQRKTEKHVNLHTSVFLSEPCRYIRPPLTLPWATAGSSTAAAGGAAAAGPPAWAPGWGTGYWGSWAGTPGSCRWRRPRSTRGTCPRRWPDWDISERATGRGGAERREGG